MPHVATIPAAILLAVAIYPLAGWLTVIVQQLYPLNPYLKDALAGLMSERPGLWKMLLVIAVTPAICEELAFRGFVLSGLRHLGRKWRAIIISSLFFGITHAIFQQSIAAFLLGLVIGYIAVQTGSLLPGMLYHVTHNSLMVLTLALTTETIARYPILGYLLRTAPDGEGYIANLPTVIVAGLIAAGLLLWFRRIPYAKTAEESLEEAINQHAGRAPTA